MDLSSNLRAIISQRLVRTADGKGRKAAIEILINTPIVADKLLRGDFHEIKTIMSKSREMGMKTFDWSLFELYNDGAISYEEAIRNSDSANELRLNIKLNGTRQPNESATAVPAAPELTAGAPSGPAPEASVSTELSLEPQLLEDAPAA
jgi:twitching motility protein PilU